MMTMVLKHPLMECRGFVDFRGPFYWGISCDIVLANKITIFHEDSCWVFLKMILKKQLTMGFNMKKYYKILEFR